MASVCHISTEHITALSHTTARVEQLSWLRPTVLQSFCPALDMHTSDWAPLLCTRLHHNTPILEMNTQMNLCVMRMSDGGVRVCDLFSPPLPISHFMTYEKKIEHVQEHWPSGVALLPVSV